VKIAHESVGSAKSQAFTRRCPEVADDRPRVKIVMGDDGCDEVVGPPERRVEPHDIVAGNKVNQMSVVGDKVRLDGRHPGVAVSPWSAQRQKSDSRPFGGAGEIDAYKTADFP
jgi:hypothetical protein